MPEIYKEYRNREYKTESSKGYTFWKQKKQRFKNLFVRQSSTKMGVYHLRLKRENLEEDYQRH